MKFRRIFSLLLALAVTAVMLAGCGGNSTAYQTPAYDGDYSYNGATAEEAPAVAPEMAAGSTGSAPLPQNRKWVITMNISAEAEEIDPAQSAIEQKILALNGYIQEQYISNRGSRRSVSMTVRIPVENLEAFLAEVNSSTHVVSSNRNVQDITLRYTDTESRIAALKAEEARLLELMAAAEDMTDLLIIEERLTEVRYELESYTSQLRRFDDQVDYATIDLDLTEVVKYTPVEEPTFWERISEGFMDSCEGLVLSLVSLLEFLIVSLPWLLFLGLVGWIIYLIVRATRKKNAKKRAAMYQQQQQYWAQHPPVQAPQQPQPPMQAPPEVND